MDVWVCSCPVVVEGLFYCSSYGFLSLKFGYNPFFGIEAYSSTLRRLQNLLSSRPRVDPSPNISPTHQNLNLIGRCKPPPPVLLNHVFVMIDLHP
jgi:hypothetical protein